MKNFHEDLDRDTPNRRSNVAGYNEREHPLSEITQHEWEGPIPVHVASKSLRERENTAHPVNGFGIHSTACVDVDRDLLWLALLSEARYTGVLVLDCSDGDGYSEREHSSNEITQHV